MQSWHINSLFSGLGGGGTLDSISCFEDGVEEMIL